jgi:hypothetical protein
MKLCIGSDIQLRTDLISLCHSSALGGHSGIVPTIKRIRALFHWKGISKDVKQFVKNCDVCQRSKYETVALPGLLSPLPIPHSLFSDISMEFITGLPVSNNKDVIFVVVDRLTKFAHFMGLKHPYTASTVAQVFLDNVLKLHGCPTTIVSDRDPIFISRFWTDLMKLLGITLTPSSAYHPQTDGLTEVLNRCLETYLRCFTMGSPTSWYKWLSLAQFWYNTSWHSSIRMSPFQALFGIQPPIHAPLVPANSQVAAVQDLLRDRRDLTSLLKHSLHRAANRMKQQADSQRSDRYFEVGSWVFVKLHPYVQKTLRIHRHSKLSSRYFGPFKVLKRIGTAAYLLELPAGSQVHPVFHVSLLKQAYGQPSAVYPFPTATISRVEPLAIVERKLIKKGKAAGVKFLVHWKGYPLQDATCEDADTFLARFPAFACIMLEDKHVFKGGSIVTS